MRSLSDCAGLGMTKISSDPALHSLLGRELTCRHPSSTHPGPRMRCFRKRRADRLPSTVLKGWNPCISVQVCLPDASQSLLALETHTPLPLIHFHLLVMYSVCLGLAVLYFFVLAASALPVQEFVKRDNAGSVSCKLVQYTFLNCSLLETQGTYYDTGTGACGYTDNNNDPIVAISHLIYGDGGSCNQVRHPCWTPAGV